MGWSACYVFGSLRTGASYQRYLVPGFLFFWAGASIVATILGTCAVAQ